jgi:hypothetical protein
MKMPSTGLEFLRLFFWASWAGTALFWLVLIFGNFVGVAINDQGVVLVVLFVGGLWCASVLCMKRAPRLALLGWLTLSPVLLWMTLGLLVQAVSHLFG